MTRDPRARVEALLEVVNDALDVVEALQELGEHGSAQEIAYLSARLEHCLRSAKRETPSQTTSSTEKSSQ